MSPLPTLRRRHRPAVPLERHAVDDLRFIHDTMERAALLTAFPGWGVVVVGLTAIVTATLAARAPNPTAWVGTWLVEAVLAMAIGGASMAFKSRRAGPRFQNGAWRRFAVPFSLPIAAGALLTARLVPAGLTHGLPGMWMLLYGAGIAAGGAFSVAPVRVMGFAFMALGAAALFVPVGPADAWMAAGFGVLHLAFGGWIARRHGG